MPKREPTPDGVRAAADRVGPFVTRTPLLPVETCAGRFWVKAESLQQGGSFKLRGATNRLLLLSESERSAGVVAFSSGNHAQGVALAARRLGIKAIIVMPFDAPAVKRDGTLAAGATIVGYDRLRESREEIASRIASETGAVLVPSFDDSDIIEGQGSAEIELGEQMVELADGTPRRVVIPSGGGGLAAGTALALPEAQIVTVEPEGWDDMARSLEAGERLAVPDDAPPTACDALQTRLVSPLTFAVLRGRARGVAVSEQQIRAAMVFAMRELRLVLEPGGAVALAAMLAGKVSIEDPRTAVILSGGNVDPANFARIVESHAVEVER